MKEVFYWGLLSALLLIASLVMGFMGIFRKRLNSIVVAIALFMLFVVCGGIAAYKVVHKSIVNVQKIAANRTGTEVYTAVFGTPIKNCVNVYHYMDPVVPIIDNALMLHFHACPNEMRRILELHKNDMLGKKIAKEAGPFGFADWFTPEKLGDSILLFSDTGAKMRTQLYVSTDSTEAYYIDISN